MTSPQTLLCAVALLDLNAAAVTASALSLVQYVRCAAAPHHTRCCRIRSRTTTHAELLLWSKRCIPNSLSHACAWWHDTHQLWQT